MGLIRRTERKGKQFKCRTAALLLALFMLGTGCTVWAEPGETRASGGLSEVWRQKNSGNTEGAENTDGKENGENADETPKAEETQKEYNTTPQLTEDDLLQMNNGNVTILYSEEGYLTFLRGTFWEEQVRDSEDGIRSLFGVAQLLGLGRGSEFYAVYGQKNKFGYTTYVYRQRYGDLTLENAVLKIFVDPDGYTCGLVSSFTPNAGIAPENEKAVTMQEAQETVRKTWSGQELYFFDEYTRQTSVTIDDIAYHAWAVFTDAPQETAEEGRPYLEHLVAYDGSYLMYMAVSSPEEVVPGDNALTEYALSWFDDKEADSWTGTVEHADGSREELTVPVVRDAEGKMYLADAGRHILVSDYYTFAYRHDYRPWASADGGDWPDCYLTAYANLIRVYDFFAEYGYVSVDGCGMPVLLLTDYCTAERQPVDNACFSGLSAGWACFCFSSVNTYGEAVDVVGHEYVHGISYCSRLGDLYANEPGALNEAASDIIGNLCEMMLGATDDTDWLIGEKSGEAIRSMSFPWLYRQPVRAGGTYYTEPAEKPSMENDFGGGHGNSSLINYIAWQLHAQGMPPEEELKLFLETLNFLTPRSGFREMHYAMEFACDVRQTDALWLGKLHMLFEQAGIE